MRLDRGQRQRVTGTRHGHIQGIEFLALPGCQFGGHGWMGTDGRPAFTGQEQKLLRETTLDNIDHTEITGPHRWYTAVGLRLSLADDGVTFGTNHHKGVSIVFKKKIPRVIGFKKHSMLWVSVADPEGFVKAIGK